MQKTSLSYVNTIKVLSRRIISNCDITCPICLEELTSCSKHTVIIPCGHILCFCCNIYIQDECPMCRGPVEKLVR